MHLFHIPQCTIQNRNVTISVLNGALWDMEQVHGGICEIGLLQMNIDLPVDLQQHRVSLDRNGCFIFTHIWLIEAEWRIYASVI